MQEASFVASEVAEGLYGPYSRPVADLVLKIVRMASDETTELEVAEVDMFGEKLQSGLFALQGLCDCATRKGTECGGLALLASRPGRHLGRARGLQGVLCLGPEPKRGQNKAGRSAKRAGYKP